MNTDARQREAMEERLMDGEAPPLEECRLLIEDVAIGEGLEAELEALKDALFEAGMQVIDTTTDEDEQRTLEIVSVE